MGDAANLGDHWLFQAGDNPAFASPAYDDRAWLEVSSARPLFTYGQHHLNQMWYRTHVHVDPGSRDLALLTRQVDGSFRVFVNGQPVGGLGSMQNTGDLQLSGSAAFPIPDAALRSGDLVIAIHVVAGALDRYTSTNLDGINVGASLFLGPRIAIERENGDLLHTGDVELGSIDSIWAVVLLLSLGLGLLIRRDTAYLAMAAQACAFLLCTGLAIYGERHYLVMNAPLDRLAGLIYQIVAIAALELFRILVGYKRLWWLRVIEGLYLLEPLLLSLAAANLLPFPAYYAAASLSRLAVTGAMAYFVLLGLRRGLGEIYALTVPVLLYEAYAIYTELRIIARYVHLQRLPPRLPALDLFNWHPQLNNPLEFALVLGYLAVLIIRTLRIVRERATVAQEFEAARLTQQVLLGSAIGPTPGFQVESVYRPASAVGGDFFLVSPGMDGSLMAIVGDVSGKGLVAALRVAMILGVLRRESSDDPAEILYGMNAALLSQGEMGFTTACCVRFEQDGRYLAANAGHLAPYVGGREIITEPALPLGLVPEQSYPLTTGRLDIGDRMVLMSDGVVEAGSAKGRLLGFERTATLSEKGAEEIADLAQSFGQEDDITVLSVARVT